MTVDTIGIDRSHRNFDTFSYLCKMDKKDVAVPIGNAANVIRAEFESAHSQNMAASPSANAFSRFSQSFTPFAHLHARANPLAEVEGQ